MAKEKSLSYNCCDVDIDTGNWQMRRTIDLTHSLSDALISINLSMTSCVPPDKFSTDRLDAPKQLKYSVGNIDEIKENHKEKGCDLKIMSLTS